MTVYAVRIGSVWQTATHVLFEAETAQEAEQAVFSHPRMLKYYHRDRPVVSSELADAWAKTNLPWFNNEFISTLEHHAREFHSGYAPKEVLFGTLRNILRYLENPELSDIEALRAEMRRRVGSALSWETLLRDVEDLKPHISHEPTDRGFLQALRDAALKYATTWYADDLVWKRAFENLAAATDCLEAMHAREDYCRR